MGSRSHTAGSYNTVLLASLTVARALEHQPSLSPTASTIHHTGWCLALHATMSSAPRVAVVTGANKGLGFAITRDLCRNFSGDVVLTARDEARGRAAVQQLQAEGLSLCFHLLDIDDLQSIRTLRDFLCKEYGGLDVLVNNAGINFDSKKWEHLGQETSISGPPRVGWG